MATALGQSFQPLFRRAILGAANTWAVMAYADSRRRWLYLQNVADEAIEIGFGTDALPPATGAMLGKPSAADVYYQGGIFEAQAGDFKFSRQAIWARGVTGGKTLLIGLVSGDAASEVPSAPGADVSSSSASSSVSASSASSASASSISSASSASSASASSASSVSASSASSASASSSSITASLSSASSASSLSTSSYSSGSSSSSSSTGP